MKVLFIDHYDSFSFNLIDWLKSGSHQVELIRVPFDDPALLTRYSRRPMPVVLSPGPNSVQDVEPTICLLRDKLGSVPVLGVCLGHQVLGVCLGGSIVRSKNPFHGSVRHILTNANSKVFKGGKVVGATYNSLVIENRSLPKNIVVSLNALGEVEMIEVETGEWPAIGVQFHPESFLSKGMNPLLDFWTQQVKKFYSNNK